VSVHRRLAALALLLAARPAGTGSPPPLDELLGRAGRYVATLEEQLAVVVGVESYRQALYIGREGSARQRRTLDSDVAWVPTGDAMVWAFYRDVRRVDGKDVRDRTGRLEALFPPGWTESARDRAQQILTESSRFNLGTRRTVNSPTLALTCLHPRNQARFEFRVTGGATKGGVACWALRWRERGRPTLVVTSRGESVPLEGVAWVEASRGAVLASETRMRPPRVGEALIETEYRLDERLGFWLPAEMRETYGNRVRSGGEDRVEARATYSAWRRAAAQVEDIILLPPKEP
jgi:hypothetical protein